jgi:hypothetical protein
MEKENFEVVTSLMTHHIKGNRANAEELKVALDILHTIFFMREQIEVGIKREGISYIGSDDFHVVCRTIDANKVKLIKIIASI